MVGILPIGANELTGLCFHIAPELMDQGLAQAAQGPGEAGLQRVEVPQGLLEQCVPWAGILGLSPRQFHAAPARLEQRLLPLIASGVAVGDPQVLPLGLIKQAVVVEGVGHLQAG